MANSAMMAIQIMMGMGPQSCSAGKQKQTSERLSKLFRGVPLQDYWTRSHSGAYNTAGSSPSQ